MFEYWYSVYVFNTMTIQTSQWNWFRHVLINILDYYNLYLLNQNIRAFIIVLTWEEEVG